MMFDVNFIVVDNDQKIVDLIDNDINQIMINNDKSYDVLKFYDYDKSFIETMNKKLTNKIYLLDIECDSASGIDIARQIRRNDLDSIIIFVTSHKELADVVASEMLNFLTYITKFDNMEDKIIKAIKLALKKIGFVNAIRVKKNGITIDIPIDDIIYIEKATCSKNCNIVTDYNDFVISKNISSFDDKLNSDFKKVNRSLIINKTKVAYIDKKNKKIFFKNKKEILY